MVGHPVRRRDARHRYGLYLTYLPYIYLLQPYLDVCKKSKAQLTIDRKVLIAFLSDRLKLRGVMMLFTLPVAIVGYAVIANVASPHVRFGMTCIMAVGMYSSVPCVLVWNSNNSAGHYKRATTSALQLAIANCGGFVASEFFLSLSLLSLSLSLPLPFLPLSKVGMSCIYFVRECIVHLCISELTWK